MYAYYRYAYGQDIYNIFQLHQGAMKIFFNFLRNFASSINYNKKYTLGNTDNVIYVSQNLDSLNYAVLKSTLTVHRISWCDELKQQLLSLVRGVEFVSKKIYLFE